MEQGNRGFDVCVLGVSVLWERLVGLLVVVALERYTGHCWPPVLR